MYTLWRHTPEMREVYGRTAVLLMPSEWEEAFGRVNPSDVAQRFLTVAEEQRRRSPK